MIYRSMFPGDLLAQLDRIERSIHQSMDMEPSIRGWHGAKLPSHVAFPFIKGGRQWMRTIKARTQASKASKANK